MKTLVATSVAAIAIVAASGLVATAAQAAACGGCSGGATKSKPAAAEVKVQTTCPVMGGKINKKQFADVKGKRIYVCCPGCIGTIKADPDKYIKKLEKEGVTLDAVPKAGVHKSKTGDHKGHKH
jgi:hypothetical protein